ncbi:MAG: hypothetical protein A2X08_05255 [Bacteroidetes bacterium GWA2_32_17]|nr:MAG: hypothetical protein A2X08_05255 [Bacteroidetes bacterium GWA2_32_17]
MGKIEGVIIKENWVYDELYLILQDAYRVIYISYQNLIPEKRKNKYINIKGFQLENYITNDLVKYMINIPKHFDYRIQKQQEDIETNSKIDIAVLYSLTFGDNTCDLKIECKRLDNLNYFITDGIEGFKTNKYAEKLKIAGFLAYNISNTLTENIELLNSKIKKKISDNEVLKEFSIIEDYTQTYKSNHKRVSNSNIDIYTMALNFKDVISN